MTEGVQDVLETQKHPKKGQDIQDVQGVQDVLVKKGSIPWIINNNNNKIYYI